MGRLKLSYNDLFYLSISDLKHLIKGHEIDIKDSWERERVGAYISAGPYLKKGTTPQTLFPFPWDAKHVKQFNMENIHERIGEFKKRIEEHKKRVAAKKNGKS